MICPRIRTFIHSSSVQSFPGHGGGESRGYPRNALDVTPVHHRAANTHTLGCFSPVMHLHAAAPSLKGKVNSI